MDDRHSTMFPASRDERLGFVVRSALIVAAVFAAMFILWQVREAMLLAFLAVVTATVLVSAAAPIERHAGLSYRWSLALAGFVLLVLFAGMLWMMGGQIKTQFSDLARQLPQSIEQLQQRLGVSLSLSEQGRGGGGLAGLSSTAAQFFGSLLSLGGTIASALSGLVVVVIGGIFLAVAPDRYRGGLVMLFPKHRQDRIDNALRNAGNALRLWLLAQLISMAIVGLLVGLGAWALGLPSPLALGIFAGLMEFIPILGPILGAVPAILLAVTQGGMVVLWTALLFLAIQQLESNLIAPLVQQQMAEVPAALLLFAVVAVGLLFGVLGVLVAAPLTVVLYVLVKQLYVRDTLGQPTRVPGES